MLSDEELDGEVEGIQRPGEGPQLRLVDFEAHRLAHAQLHPVQAHRAVVVQVGEHEEQGQVGRGLGGRLTARSRLGGEFAMALGRCSLVRLHRFGRSGRLGVSPGPETRQPAAEGLRCGLDAFD